MIVLVELLELLQMDKLRILLPHVLNFIPHSRLNGLCRLRFLSAAIFFFPAAHLVLTSTTIAVITSTLINLGIIAEPLNP